MLAADATFGVDVFLFIFLLLAKKSVLLHSYFKKMDLLYGIICGVVLSLFFSFGPAFFSLIQTSIQYGYRRAWWMPLGICCSDAVVIFLMLTVLKGVDMFEVIHNPYVAVIGGAMMIVMGVITFRRKVRQSASSTARVKFRSTQKSTPQGLFLNGFVVNILNPMIWVFWLAVIALISGELDIKTNHMYLFFAGLLGATLGFDLLKCKLASLFQRTITANVLNIFNKCTGIIFFVFAGYLIVSMVYFQINPEARDKQMEKDKDPTSTKVIKRIGDGLHDTGTFHIGRQQ